MITCPWWFGVLALLLGGAVVNAQVGPAERIIKERARGATNDLTQRSANPSYTPSGKTRPAPPAPAPQTPAAVQIPELAGPQLKAAQKLRRDLDAVKSREDAPNHVQTLTQDLLQAATGPKQPALNSLMALAADLAGAWPGQKLAEAEKDQFVQNVVHLLNAGGQSPAVTQKVLHNAEGLLKKSGMAETDVKRLSANLRTLVGQLQR